MMKHIRDAIELSGVPPSQVQSLNKPGHVILVVNGRRILCSCSPKNTHIDRETVTTPWGTTQVVPFRYGVPVRSSREEREAIVEKVKASNDRIQMTKDIGAVKTFMWGKPAMSINTIELGLHGEVKRANVRAILKDLIQRGEVLGDCEYLSGNGARRAGGVMLKPEGGAA